MNFTTKVNLVKLLEEINKLEFWQDGSQALMAIKPCTPIGWINNFPFIKQAVTEISKARNAPALYCMINNIPPGVEVPVHTDTLLKHPSIGEYPKLERFHLPIITNTESKWWDELSGDKIMVKSTWYGPIPYWLKHSVKNLGKTNRIHLVVDLDKQVMVVETVRPLSIVESTVVIGVSKPSVIKSVSLTDEVKLEDKFEKE